MFNLLAVQGTLKSLLQHHSLKASIVWLSAFFMGQFSHPYMTTRKTIALKSYTGKTIVSKVMSLLFNTLSMFVIAPSKEQASFISWLQSPSAVILEPIKYSLSLFPLFLQSICCEVIIIYYFPQFLWIRISVAARLRNSGMESLIRMWWTGAAVI